MADSKRSGVEDAVEGAVEGVKGKVKEAAGAVTGRDELKREGEAQKDKGASLGDAAKREAEAEKARREAELNKARQRAHQ